MGQSRLSIGEFARASGLGVSALRFYDASGVIRPAHVDPDTGYRSYETSQVALARLVAQLRQVRMPLADICAVLAARDDPATTNGLLDRHLRLLEDGLADARRRITHVRRSLRRHDSPHTRGTAMTEFIVGTSELNAAIDGIRFAVGTDPELPSLRGVFLDLTDGVLRLVATDRYRLAVCAVAVRDQVGPDAALIAPLEVLERGAEPSVAEVPVRLLPGAVRIGSEEARPLPGDFPDYRAVLRRADGASGPASDAAAVPIPVSAADLVEDITSGPSRTLVQAPGNVPHRISALLARPSAASSVGSSASPVAEAEIAVVDAAHPGAIGVNQRFLLEAIESLAAARVSVSFDGPLGPLTLRDPARPQDVSMVMPTRLAAAG